MYELKHLCRQMEKEQKRAENDVAKLENQIKLEARKGASRVLTN